MKTLEEVERMMRELKIHTNAEIDAEILTKAALELDAAVKASHPRRSMLDGRWTKALRSRPFRFAVAAAVLCGLVLGAELLRVFDGTGVIWAEVVDRMALMDRFSFQLKIGISADESAVEYESAGDSAAQTVAMSYSFSSALGSRWDIHTDGELAASFVYPSSADSGLAINYTEETWSFVANSARPPAGVVATPLNDPEAYVRHFLERGFSALGRSEIDGIEVEGVEVIDPPTRLGPGADAGTRMQGTGRLWVGVESGLPARIELEQSADDGRVNWTFDFRWGAEVETSVFAANVPQGFSRAR